MKNMTLIILLIAIHNMAYSQVYNAGEMYVSGNAYCADSFTNASTAAYLNDGNFYVAGDFINNVPGLPSGNGSTIFMGSSTQNIRGFQPSNFNHVIINNSTGVIPGVNISLTGNWTNNGIFNAGNYNVTLNGTVAQSVTGSMATTFYDLTNSNIAADITMGNNVTLANTFNANPGSNVSVNSNTLTFNGTITGSGTLAGSSSSTLVIGGSSIPLGTLYFKNGAELLNNFILSRTGTVPGYAVNLGTDLTVNNITLAAGILTTGSHLFTWNNTGALTAPNIPFTLNNTGFSDSYIATCNSDGSSLSITTPFTGNMGFKILNVGGGSDVYFPVGSDLVSANRMMINMNNSVTSDFTVVLGKGDIGTIDPRVNRIWYVHASNPAGATATMKLFFTKHTNFAQWPNPEDEIEPPFPYAHVRLVQKNYGSTYFINQSTGSDIQTNWGGVPVNTEVYGLYTKGISQAFDLSQNGITGFNEFSVIDGADIILPVTITNIKAWQDGTSIKIAWASSNEINIDHYEIERALDVQHFTSLGIVQAKNSGLTTNYQFTDAQPANGNNYYRIKVIDKSGAVNYTSIVVVNIGKGIVRAFIYPNPAIRHAFNLQLTNLDAGNYNLQLFDGGGRMLVNKKVEHFGGSSTQQIMLPPGTAAGAYKVILFSNSVVIYNTTLIVAE